MRWCWDPVEKKLVTYDEYQEAKYARNAPIMVDRYMEGTRTTDGVDIGSRQRRREYMHVNNVADFDDFTEHRVKERARQEREDVKDRREKLAKSIWLHTDGPLRRR